MKTPTHPKHCRALAIVLLAFLALASDSARADHLRGAIISWQPAPPGSRTVRFNVQYSQRWSFPVPNRPFACPSSGLCLQVGATIPLFGEGTGVGGSFDFGDGSAPLNPGSAPTGTVTSINNAEDWYVATFTFTHTYPDCTLRTAHFAASVRVYSLVLAHDKPERVEVQVSPCAATGSAIASMPAIQAVPLLGVAEFSLSSHIAKADPSDNLSYRLATSAEMFGPNNTFPCTLSSGVYSGGSGQPPGLSIDSATGRVTWDTGRITAATDTGGSQCLKPPETGELWAVQFIVTVIDKNRKLKGTTPVDVILQFVKQVGSPPTLTFVPAGPLSVTVGSPVSFTATGNSTNANAKITLNASGVPPGAPVSNLNRQLPPPVTSSFNWTPTTADIGQHVVTYTATDENSQQAVKSMIINVVNAPPLPDLQITTASLPPATQMQPYSSRLAGAGGVPPYQWSADFPADAGLSLNPATGEITGTPRHGGSYQFIVNLGDSQGHRTSRTFTLQINAVPGMEAVPFLLEPQRAIIGTPAKLVAGLRLPSGRQASTGELPPGLKMQGDISGNPVEFTPEGDGRFTATTTFRSTGDVPVRLRATGDSFDSSGEGIVNVTARFAFTGDPILVDLGHLKAGGASCRQLPFARDQEGQVPLRFRLLQSLPARHTLSVARAGESYHPGATIPLNAADQLEICLSSSRWAPSSQASGEPWIALITGGDSDIAQVRLTWQVEELSFWERWGCLLLALLILALIAFLVYGYIWPQRFPRDLALTFVPEYEDLDASPQPLAQWRGVGIGFYRDAKAFLHPDFRVSGKSRGALAMLKASKQGVWVAPVHGLLYREVDVSDWEELHADGRTARAAIVYRVGEAGPFFRLTSSAPRRRS